MAVFEGKKSSNDILNNGTMSADEVVASDVPPRYLFHVVKLASVLLHVVPYQIVSYVLDHLRKIEFHVRNEKNVSR